MLESLNIFYYRTFPNYMNISVSTSCASLITNMKLYSVCYMLHGTNHRFLSAQPKLSDHCPYLETKSQTNPSPVFSSAPSLWPSAELYISLRHCVGDWVTRWVRKLKISVNIDARTLKFGMKHPRAHWLRLRKNQSEGPCFGHEKGHDLDVSGIGGYRIHPAVWNLAWVIPWNIN